MKTLLATFIILGSVSLPAFAKVTLNKPIECHTVLDVVSESINGKEKNSAVLLCRMDPKDMNSTEEVKVTLTTQGQVTILTSLYTGNRPLFKGDPLVGLATIVRSANGDYILQKLNTSVYSLD